MKRTGFAVVVALAAAGCGSGGSPSTALPTIPAVPPAAASPTPSPSDSPAAIPTSTSASPGPSAAVSELPTTYANPRYGFRLGVPPGFVRHNAPVDGDGQEFISTAGPATLNVFGANNVNHLGVDADYAQLTAPRAGTEVTYAVKAGNAVTVSGTAGGSVFYQRDLVGPGSIDTLVWTYPISAKTSYDRLVTATVASFTSGDVDASH